MAAPRLFSRDRRNRTLRVALALLLSVIAHVILIFEPREVLTAAAPKAPATLIEARLVGNGKTAPVNILAEHKPPSEAASARVGPVKELLQTPAITESPPSTSEPQTTATPSISVDPVFYTWREVDVPAHCTGESNAPSYPQAAADLHIIGQVIIEVWIDETGNVDDAKVIDANPPGYFEEAALQFHKALHCSPAMKEGKAKRYRARFIVEFGPQITIGDRDAK